MRRNMTLLAVMNKFCMSLYDLAFVVGDNKRQMAPDSLRCTTKNKYLRAVNVIGTFFPRRRSQCESVVMCKIFSSSRNLPEIESYGLMT
jgi:hypothetical protein